MKENNEAIVSALRAKVLERFDQLVKDGHINKLVNAIMDEILSGKKITKNPKIKYIEVNTRTAAGRREFDKKVLEAVNSGIETAEKMHAATGGTKLQIRTSLNRLIKNKKIKKSGKARGTRYYPINVSKLQKKKEKPCQKKSRRSSKMNLKSGTAFL